MIVQELVVDNFGILFNYMNVVIQGIWPQLFPSEQSLETYYR